MASNVVNPQERIEKKVAVFEDKWPLAISTEYKDHVKWRTDDLGNSEGESFRRHFSENSKLLNSIS